MDEVREFCIRVLGTGPAAVEAHGDALTLAGPGRIARLAAAARACRRLADAASLEHLEDGQEGLRAAVARELASAAARLPERHREVLALRELLRLSHEQIARVMGVDVAAVPPLVARARLRLRAERRAAGGGEQSRCPDRERALRALVCRQDSEPLSADDDQWLLAHLRSCPECSRAHGAMLEASACYRAWPVAQDAPAVRSAGRPPRAVRAGAAG